jgi:hypothetical protein
MLQHHPDTMSSNRHGRRILLRLACITAVAFALVAASVSAAPKSLKSSAAPIASTAADSTKCVAQIQVGSKLEDVYERYYKYAFKKVKGSKKYKKVIVRSKRKLMVSCTRACVRTKAKKTKKYKYKTVVRKGKKVKVRTGKPKTVTVRQPIYKTVKKTVTVKKGSRLVKVKKKVRVYTYEKCATKSNSAAGTPVKITMLNDSYATLDFGAFVRKAPITGTLTGFIPGGYQINQDNQINLTRGNLALGQTNVFIDDDCHGGQVSAAIRTGNPTAVTLDPTRQSISTLQASGTVTATAYTKIQLPLELRNDDDGCDAPYITTGYTDFPQTFFLKGKIAKGLGLAKLTLTSAPDPLDVQACLSPGAPTSPCNNTALIIPLPIIVSTHLVVSVVVG